MDRCAIISCLILSPLSFCNSYNVTVFCLTRFCLSHRYSRSSPWSWSILLHLIKIESPSKCISNIIIMSCLRLIVRVHPLSKKQGLFGPKTLLWAPFSRSKFCKRLPSYWSRAGLPKDHPVGCSIICHHAENGWIHWKTVDHCAQYCQVQSTTA